MKKFIKKLLPVLCVSALLFAVSCELDDDSGGDEKAFTLKATSVVKKTDNLNNGEKQLRLTDGRRLVVSDQQTFVLRIRTSCSGSDPNNVSSIKNGDQVTYFYTSETADFAGGIIRPFEVHAVSAACLEAGAVQFVLDSDFDGVGDIVDPEPFNPDVP